MTKAIVKFAVLGNIRQIREEPPIAIDFASLERTALIPPLQPNTIKQAIVPFAVVVNIKIKLGRILVKNVLLDFIQMQEKDRRQMSVTWIVPTESTQQTQDWRLTTIAYRVKPVAIPILKGEIQCVPSVQMENTKINEGRPHAFNAEKVHI